MEPNVRNPNYIVRISDVVRNPNDLTTELLLKTPKSERSDFGALLYMERVKYIKFDVFLIFHFTVSKAETSNKNISAEQNSNKNISFADRNSNKNEGEKVYSTPSIPRQLHSRAFELSKISTPRPESSSLMSIETSLETDKLKCFGFEDDDDDVINNSTFKEFDLFSPIRKPNNLPSNVVSTPLPSSPRDQGVRPHRFNLSINRSTGAQKSSSVSLVIASKSALVEINKNSLSSYRQKTFAKKDFT